MEEEKATAYYDELVRKGGNAAKFKQGLGFGTSQTTLPKAEAYGSLSNFVKQGSPGRAAALEKEIRIDGIRDKLKKRENAYSSRKRSPDRSRRELDEEIDDSKQRKKRIANVDLEERTRGKQSRRQSSPLEERDREIVKKSDSGRKRRSKSRSGRSKSPIHHDRRSKERLVPPEKVSKLKTRKSVSPSQGSPGTSSEQVRKHSRASRRDHSSSPREESRSRRRKFPEKIGRSRRSRSRSEERRGRDRSRSRSRGRHDNHKSYRRRDHSYSPHESGRGGRSPSPGSHRSSYKHREDRCAGRVPHRSESHRVDRGRRRDVDDRRRGRSPARDTGRKTEEKSRISTKERLHDLDYSRLIPNFDSMTPAEKVKAKMKHQLSETVVKDQAKGMSDEWERFDFNKDAPLDDDAKQDYFGDGTGARDDIEFLKNTGSTFLSSSNQVTREAQVKSVHDNAIFGPPQGLRIRVTNHEGHPVGVAHAPDDLDDQPLIVEETEGASNDESAKTYAVDSADRVNNVVSQQVIAMQQAGSWQERARKMRESRAGLNL